MFQYTYDLCYSIAHSCETKVDFKHKNASAYAVARKHGWLSAFTWFQNGHKRPKKWSVESCTETARQYSRKVDFQRNASGAYKFAVSHDLLSTFTWFENRAINIEHGHIYSVYRYRFTFEGRQYIYVGLTLRPKIRDRRHRLGDSSVFDFSIKSGIPIPAMEILEDHLTQIEAREREDVYRNLYARTGVILLNRAKTGRMIGSVGGMHRKWGRTACMREARKFKSRGDFEKGSPSAYQAALEKKWLNDYTWFEVVHHPTWTRDSFFALARNYKSIKEFQTAQNGAYIAGVLRGWIRECSWFVPGRGWCLRVSRHCKNSRKIRQYTTDGQFIAEFNSLAAAIRASGIMSIRKCLIKERKQAGGFCWKYADDIAPCEDDGNSL